jgi:hypothetical protein
VSRRGDGNNCYRINDLTQQRYWTYSEVGAIDRSERTKLAADGHVEPEDPVEPSEGVSLQESRSDAPVVVLRSQTGDDKRTAYVMLRLWRDAVVVRGQSKRIERELVMFVQGRRFGGG